MIEPCADAKFCICNHVMIFTRARRRTVIN